jgi:hypothetical protein
MKAYKPHHQESRTQVRLFFHPSGEGLPAGGYLQAVGSKGQLDFIRQERKYPATTPTSSIGLSTEPASAAAQARQKLYGTRYDALLP